jgi:4-hydroxy-tetrahydrodipicolinate synthase
VHSVPASLTGVVPPLCTPLTADQEIDVPSLERLTGSLLDAGCRAVFALGSTGEVAFLPDSMRRRVLEVVTGFVAGAAPVLAGVIDMTTMRVLDHLREAEKYGCTAVVATAPFYARINAAETERHFQLIAGSTDLQVYAYDLPVAVGHKLPADLVLRLTFDGTLAGVKDSSGDDGALRTLIAMAADAGLDDVTIMTGSELTVDSALRMGASGVVPGLGNVDPTGYVRIFEAAAADDWETARIEQERLLRLFQIVNIADPARIGRSAGALGAFKAALYLLGTIDCAKTMEPQLPLLDEEISAVRAHLVEAGLSPRR